MKAMRFLFSLQRALQRLYNYPLVTLSLFTAFACIGALLAPYLGIDHSIMMRASTLPFTTQADTLRIACTDEALAQQLETLSDPAIAARASLYQQDEQCLTPTGMRLLRIQSLLSDETNLLALPLAEDEAALNTKSKQRLSLLAGDPIWIQGQEYRVRVFEGNMEGGVDLMLRKTLPYGLREYIFVFTPSKGTDALMLLQIIEEHINRPILPQEQGGILSYEITHEKVQTDNAAMRNFYTRLLIILLAGALFTLSQMAALMRYHAIKCSRQNALCRQWRGLAGMMQEQLLSLCPLAFVASLLGYFLSLFAVQSINGTSPMGTHLGPLLTACITTVLAIGFAFLNTYPQHKKKSLSTHIKEDA